LIRRNSPSPRLLRDALGGSLHLGLKTPPVSPRARRSEGLFLRINLYLRWEHAQPAISLIDLLKLVWLHL
jgi:hypothetical protein